MNISLSLPSQLQPINIKPISKPLQKIKIPKYKNQIAINDNINININNINHNNINNQLNNKTNTQNPNSKKYILSLINQQQQSSQKNKQIINMKANIKLQNTHRIIIKQQSSPIHNYNSNQNIQYNNNNNNYQQMLFDTSKSIPKNHNLIQQRSLSHNSNRSKQRSNSPKIVFKFISPQKDIINNKNSLNNVNFNVPINHHQIRNNLVQQKLSPIKGQFSMKLSNINEPSNFYEQLSSSFIKGLHQLKSPQATKKVNSPASNSSKRRMIPIGSLPIKQNQKQTKQLPIQTFNQIQLRSQKSLQSNQQFSQLKPSENQKILQSGGSYMRKTANFSQNLYNFHKINSQSNCINNTLDATNATQNKNQHLISIIQQLQRKLHQSQNEIKRLNNILTETQNQNNSLKKNIQQKQLQITMVSDNNRASQLQIKKLSNQLKMYKVQQKEMQKQIELFKQGNEEKQIELQKCRAFIKNVEQNMAFFKK